jgi:alpha-L-fucosidase
MFRQKVWALTVVIACATALLAAAPSGSESDRLQWWRDAHFGMFIHWGLYCIPAGEWKGQPVNGIGEWIMNRAKIPVAEYEQLAKQFNPTQFNADDWVRVAQAAGQRYMVITAKHHDGFAMFRSKVSKYNVYDATPFHRDVVGELAAACRRAGMPLGFYYSQTQDWHEPDGDGNTWDFDPAKANFDKYFHEKAIPQVRELLTNYGPVALIWFDTPKNITPAQSKELVDLVHTLQPKCLVDGRIGNNAGDYVSTGDNEIPSKKLSVDWEVPATLNDTWGFKKNDTNWKSPQTLIRQLVDIVSKNGNYLLNVGPTSQGLIPQPSIDRLKQVGAWLKVSGEAVYGAQPSPYPYEFDWGSITAKNGQLFLNIVEWPANGSFTLYGLENKVVNARLLAKPQETVKADTSGSDLHLTLPRTAPDPDVSVVALSIDGTPRANQNLTQQPDGSVTLNGQFVQLGDNTRIKISNRGILNGWTGGDEKLGWTFRLRQPGEYQVIARTTRVRGVAPWESGDQLKVSAENQTIEHALENDGTIADPRNPLTPDIKTDLGMLKLTTGTVHLTVEATTKNGVHLREIILQPKNTSQSNHAGVRTF